MDLAELSVEILKQRARAGDRKALQALRERGFFQSRATVHGFPASRAQRRLWVSAHKDRDSDAYVISLALRLRGPLRQTELQHAMETLFVRHETLRTRFVERAGDLRQFVDAPGPLPLTVWDFRAAANPEAECRACLQRQVLMPFDLRQSPLWRVHLCQLGDADHVWALLIHHIIADAWSLEVLQRELALIYQAYCAGRHSPLPPLVHQYRDYAAGKFSRETATEVAASRRYWQEKLAAPLPLLQLPTDFPRSSSGQSAGASLQVHWDEARVGALQDLAARHDATLFIALQALVKLLLYRYSGQTDLIIGTPIAGRDSPALEGQVGLFINLLALRDQIDPEGGFDRLLEQASQTAYDAYTHRDYPFDSLIDDLTKPFDTAPTQLFNVLVALQNVAAADVALSDLQVGEFPLSTPFAKYDLIFEFAQHGESLVLLLTYSTGLFEAATIERLCGHLGRMLEAVLAEPDRAIRELPLLSRAEQQQLAVWNRTAASYPRQQTVAALYTEQAAATPEAVALAWAGGEMSYGELEVRANRLAHYLQDLVASGPDQVIGLCLERSAELIVGMLGILKAGAAYLPLDPSYPAERLAFMLADAGVALLVTQASLAPRLSESTAEIICLDRDGPAIARCPVQAPVNAATAESLAYVMYTSGSTGQPKGVCVPHAAISRLVLNTNYIRLGPGDRVGQAATPTFDAATFEIWGALLNGATVHLLGREELLDPARLARHIRERRVTILFLTTALFNRLVQLDAGMFQALDYLLFGGEAVDPRWVAAVLEGGRPRHLLHVYGPTESTTFATWQEVAAVQAGVGTVPIGQPLANTQVYVLDAQRQAVGIGLPGELYIGGDGLARGYLKRPELTAERFLEVAGLGRLYRTGDRGRWRSDGALEFLGRLDEQVKLRGFRIEPGEIEALLRREAEVREAVVVAQGQDEHRQLVAYLLPVTGTLDVSVIRQRLRRQLPDYMVPGQFVVLDELPLSANGKVDRSRLPAPETPAAASQSDGQGVPLSPSEELLAGLWCEVLKRETVSREDNFFELGGHSLMAMQVLSRIRDNFAVDLPLYALFEQPVLADLAAQIDASRQSDPLPPLLPRAGEGEFPLSFAQQRLWFLSELQAEAAAPYSINAALRLDGGLDQAALRTALRQLTARQMSLRMNFRNAGGHPVISLRAPYDPLTVEDLCTLPGEEQEAAIGRLAEEHARQPFDLAHNALLRLRLLELGTGASVLLFSIHHIIADGWSLGVLVRELSALYGAARGGRAAELPALPVQYPDYAAWQRGWLSGEVLARQLGYWREQLAGAPRLLELPTDYPRPAVKTYGGAQLSQGLEPALVAELQRLSTGQGATLFMTLLAAFATLLARASGQEDLVVGTPIANRTQRQTEGLIGFFVNTLVLRCRVAPERPFSALLADVRQTALGAYAHQDLPFELLVGALQPERSLGHSPLFQVMFALQNAPAEALRLDGLRLQPLAPAQGLAKFDLTLTLEETAGGLGGVWEYSTDLFTAQTIARLAEHFAVLLRGIVADPDQALRRLPLLTAAERQQLAVWNDTATDYPRQQTVAARFAAQAAATPEAVALAWAGGTLSYGELEGRANRLAHYLQARLAPGPEPVIGLCLERAAELVVGMLGILKAGAAYLPLDADYPAARLHFMLADAGVALLVTQASLAPRLSASAAALICLDRDGPAIARCPLQAPVNAATAESLAYVMYTSGSTGQPKGVCVPQRAVVRLVTQTNYARLTAAEVFLQYAPVSFDAATFEIWGALLNGATLVLMPPGQRSLAELGGVMQQQGVTTLWLTSSLFNLLLDEQPTALQGVRQLLVGGEALSVAHVRRALEAFPDCQLINGYGPTENTTFTCCYAIARRDYAGSIPIGAPIANTTAYILDAWQQPVPIGLPGELYVGGDGLARGYLHRPELTVERFVEVPGVGRLYRTGDRGRWREDGTIEFLGRLDQQIKLRGFRIEPGEIEALLRREPEVQDAVVGVHGAAPHQQLVAYLLPARPPLDIGPIRQSLRRQLPDYMVPGQFVVLDEWPLSANGKLDRSRLPAPETPAATQLFEAPRTELERRLAAIWSAVLGTEHVGRHDNFFELGGDSILSIQIIARSREEGIQFTVSDLFAHQTLADLCPHVREAATAVPEIATTGRPVPLTPIQKWFFCRDLEEPWHFNQSVLLRPHQALSVDVLRDVLRALLDQHAALRLRYRQTTGGWVQTYAEDEDALPLHVDDLSDLPGAEQPGALQERATAWQRSLNLSEGPLSRVVLFKLSDGQRLLWCIHHLVVDGVSWRILLGDLQMALEAVRRGVKPQLPPPSAPFSAWAQYLDVYAQDPQLAEDTAYWETLPEPSPLPLDFSNGEPALDSTAYLSFCLDKADTRALLEEVHSAYNLRINDVLLTALAQALASWTGRRDCVIDLEGHGRVERNGAPDLSRTVGWFTTIYPVHLALPALNEPAACLKAIKEQLRAVPLEGLGYGVSRYIKTSTPPALLEAAVAFNYLGQFDQVVRHGLFAFAGEGIGESHTRKGRRTRLLDVEAVVSNGELQVIWGYSDNQYRRATIQQLADDFAAALRMLIAHCQMPSSAGYTPSDFPLAALTQEQLDAFATRHGRNIAAIYPLSPMQQGMLFHSVYEGPGGSAYFEQLHCHIEGPLDTARFRAAWAAVLQRHPVLRTAFQQDAHTPVQIVYREVALPWQEADWRDLDAQQQQQSLDALLAEERQRGFDLSRPPLLRCHLARLGEQSYQFVWCFHHLLLDGWSLPILFHELFSLLAMPTADLPPLRPYQDYIAWLQRQDVEAAAAHWRGYLAGFNAPTPLPGARQVAGEKSAGLYAEATFTLDEPASQRILQFASAQHLTVSTLLQTAWALLLHRYSGESDVVFGVTVSGRNIDLHGIDHMLGLFINTVPLRLRIDDDPLWALLQARQGEHQGNMQFSNMSLNEIQRCSALPNGTPLFGTILVFENYPMETSMPQDEQGGLRFVNVQAVDHTSYPLTIVAAAGQTLQFRIGYDTYHFERASIERLFGHLRNLLLGIATSDAECRSRDLWLMDSDEQEQLIGWSRAKQPASEPQTLVEMFAAQVARDPARVAVTCNGEQVTYQQLSARAKQLAQRLRHHGTGPDRLVGLCVSRSLELVVGILGILESGAAYLPLDPDVPQSRLAFMLEDADAVALVTQRALAERLPEVDVPRLYLDGFEESDGVAAEGQDAEQTFGLQPQHLAYVIYTSGSTGQPKGVMVTHANVTRLFAATWPEFHFSTDDVWTLFHSVAFDFSVWELWGALLFGGRLVIVPHHISRDPVAFYDLLEAEGVTILNQTPSAFRQLIPVAQRMGGRLPLRLVIFGGEALDLPTLRPWFDLYGDQQPRLINMYGITETTVHVTWCPLRSSDTQSTASLIGRPLADLDVYLLDGQGRPVPQGVAGEIYVGGAGLARGYLNRPALSEERFIEQGVFGQRLRLYRSGDLARWGANGNLVYLGRIDHQIKLRGFRIELGEIESTLSQHREVREAVVVARGPAPQQYLAAYLVLEHQEVTSEELRQWLATRLPNYMIPTHLIVLDSLPLTVNGKVDQQALPEPRDAHPPGTAVYVPPRDNVEKQLVSIWQEALGCTNIGIEDNFFELGGHSLTAMQIVSAIYKTIGVKIPLRGLFEHPTIAALAAIIKTSRDGAYLPIQPVPIQPDYPLSHSQLRLWLDNKMAGSATFNMPEALLFNENLDVAALKQALNALVMRHETLRTFFIEVEGKPRQRIHSQLDIGITEVDLSTETRFDERTREIIDQEAITPFDVETLPLFRVTLIKQSGTRCVLVLVIHHIIGDGWSKNVLYQELSILYNAFSHGLPNPLEPLRIQYKDYAVWETTLGFEQAERYWLDELAGAPTHISLPYDFPPPVERLFYGDRRSLNLGPETSQELRNIAASRGTTLSTVMFALYQLFLFQVSRQDDLCVSTVVANRNHPDLENQIGCFVNILPLRTRLSQDMEFEQLLNQIIRSSYAVLEHQNYPFDRLVRHFNRAGGPDLRPFLDVGYLFQNSFDTHLKIGAQIPHDIPRQEGSVEFSFGFAKFDLSLTIIDQGQSGVTLTMEYDSALFLENTVLGYLNTLERFATMAAGWSKATSGKRNTGVYAAQDDHSI